MEAARYWEVPKEYFDPLYNYLIHGFHPGGFWRAALANDFLRAMLHSHPANSIPQLKNTAGWIQDQFPELAHGSYERVDYWCDSVTAEQRRHHLETARLIYTEEDEVMMALKGIQPKPEPFMW